MFKKPTKEKVTLKEGSVKLTESTESPSPAGGALAPIDGVSSDRDKDLRTDAEPSGQNENPPAAAQTNNRNRGNGQRPRIVLQKPSLLLLSVLLAILLSVGTAATFVGHPKLIPFTASILFNMRQPILSAMVLDAALSRYPNDSGFLLQRGAVRETMGAYEGALKDATKAVSLLPPNSPALAEAYALQGACYFALHQHAEAEKCLKLAGSLKQGAEIHYHQLGYVALEMQDNPLRCIQYESIALLINPHLPKSYLNRSNAEWKTNQYQKAVDDASKGIQELDQPANANLFNDNFKKDLRQSLLNNRSDAYYGLGDYANAIKDAITAADLADKAAQNTENEPDSRPYHSLVKSYLANNQPDLALKTIDAVKDKIVRDGPLLLMQKQALLMQKKTEEAANAGPQSREEIEEAFREFYRDAYIYSESKDYQNTIRATTLALMAKPDNMWCLRMRAEAYRALHQYNRVLEDTTTALTNYVGGSGLKGWLHYMRAEALEKLGRNDEANAGFDAAKKLGWTKERTERERKNP